VLDDFLALGGDSLKAIQILARIRAALGFPVEEATIFRAPTVEAMALAILAALAEPPA